MDRTTEKEAVISFLTELRKYYIPGTCACKKHLNTITFIANIKPETELNSNKESDELNSLYAKIFDYVLNLQTINVDNYDAVLEGILKEKSDAIQDIGLLSDRDESPLGITGMQWIIRERRIGIREIKERLNIAFTLYESLTKKFPRSGIAFEKCAAVAYLTTAFEKDFIQTDDRAFQKLVDLYLENRNAEYENYASFLPETCQEYIKTVWELIDAKLINSSYRTYFYNYPRNSNLYTADESQVINAILYGEQTQELNLVAKRVLESKSKAPKDAFQKIEQLGIRLPDVVFQEEPLYIEALRHYFNGIKKKVDSLDYSPDGTEKTIALFKQILAYDANREFYKETYARAFCQSWESNFRETAILQLRNMLCKEFPHEIMWYKQLFFGIHGLISQEEMDQLSLSDVIKLINMKATTFSVKEVQYVQAVYEKGAENHTELIDQIERFLREALSIFKIQLASILLNFMLKAKRIVPDFESLIAEKFKSEVGHLSDTSNTAQLFKLYQRLINEVAPQGLSDQTLEIISTLDQYEGYSAETAKQLYEHDYNIEYILIAFHLGQEIQYKDKTLSALKENVNWLLGNHLDYFIRMRQHIIETQTSLPQFGFLFSENCPIMTSNELATIDAKNRDGDGLVISFVPSKLVMMDAVEMLSNYFWQEKAKQ